MFKYYLLVLGKSAIRYVPSPKLTILTVWTELIKHIIRLLSTALEATSIDDK